MQNPLAGNEDLLSSFEMDNITPSLKEKLDKHSDLVNNAYTVFKSVYSSAFKPTVVSSIINGEIIETKPDNIFVHHAIKFEDELFEKKCQFCSKTLYDYQKNAILKLRELELMGYNINPHTGQKVISNGWLLSLPIGSGKSLVFQFLALFYREIPCHPIIISTDGTNIPDHDQMQWKYYPYFYENCGYIEDQPNSVIALTNYKQRRCTVILTHQHLLEQMEEYFNTDFPAAMAKRPGTNRPFVSVIYPVSLNVIKDISDVDIIVVPATQENVDRLVEWSYEAPFIRVIIDDYTSMPNIDTFRQILATSTIFVSGSGFDRKEEDIPASYYTLKYMPTPKISLVGRPEETLKGIFRDSIATMELMGSSCEFSQYEFVTSCDEMVRQMFNSIPTDIYPPLRTSPYIHNYMALTFVLKYIDRIKCAIGTVERDLTTKNEDKSIRLEPERVSWYLEWKKLIADTTAHPPPTERVKLKDGTIGTRFTTPSLNPLYNMLFVEPGNGQSAGSCLVQQECYCCRKRITDHNGYGMLSCCCGAFFCSSCLRSMCTHDIADKRYNDSNHIIHDPDNYYCVCCRKKNPKYYFNVNKKKDTNVFSYNLVNDFFDTSELKGHTMFDYYFYMFLKGFTPLYHEGKTLNIQNDIEQGHIKADIFHPTTGPRVVPLLETILPKDQLGITALNVINKTLYELTIMPRKGSTILFYGCPKYMWKRVIDYYTAICTENNPATALTVAGSDGVKKHMQPLSVMTLDSKDSVASLIGLHKNIVAIIQWKTPDKADEISQLVGRMLRLNNFNNKLYFYIVINTLAFE